ncbi:MAG: tRNA (adenosine(37)-N6)-threonylcarbamoyltransferase complex ATPase subunit type 1 TsaE [Sideroxydans sp.]|nr:tRNA (adenosine(37)-N6)-threonylcarbamoyltransferase complex ATPase subunit type 1 TsaE [Sideroxydans sp.]
MCFRLTQAGIRNTNSLKAKLAAPCFDAQGKFIHFQPGITILHDSNHSPIVLPNEEATAAFALRLAHAIRPGLVIYLRGDLGAGKTTLVRALLLALGYKGRVKSPTYTLVESYDVRGLHLRHFDLYRFRDADEWEEAGFRDEFDAHNICLVEWPEQAAGLLPEADLSLTFEILQDGREIFLHAYTEAGTKCLNAL